eukprot:1576948-Alexandrium_andersonii.AAC.1
MDGSAPWTNPDPAGTNYVWAHCVEVCAQTGENVPLTWQLLYDPDGPAPRIGNAAFGPLPPDFLGDPIDMFGINFPPRPPLQPIAASLDTGALAEDH